MAEDIIRDAPADAAKMAVSPYLSWFELNPKGWHVLITDVRQVTLQKNAIVKKEETKALILLSELDGRPVSKPLVCNKTNLKTLIKMYGRNWKRDWLGKPITLYPTTCSGKAGETVDCIRIRPDAPAIPTTTATQAQPEAAPAREPGSDDQ